MLVTAGFGEELKKASLRLANQAESMDLFDEIVLETEFLNEINQDDIINSIDFIKSLFDSNIGEYQNYPIYAFKGVWLVWRIEFKKWGRCLLFYI